ncbi:MAG: class I SAM-dependent methyltransferase [Steroidobacteraceae bacterium]
MKINPALPLLALFGFAAAAPAATDAAAVQASSSAVAPKADVALVAAVNGDWRSAEEKARDQYRHPVEALTFWGLQPGMTILEIQPGSGWWTDILAPYAKATGGKFYATAADLANPQLSEGSRKARAEMEARFAAKPGVYGKPQLLNWGAVSRTLPHDTFDFILTARSIHGWMQDKPGTVEATFAEFYKALREGGVLAVEQHRANATGGAEKPETGYVSEQYVIDQATKAGFRLAGQSAINANPKDTKDHPFGVWTLPPNLRSTPYGSAQDVDPAFDHSKYVAIGESDRMTLRFVKP